MPIQTDLSVSPYFDDYNESNDYYKILFRPGVAVQTREINQLQTMLQKQIERFGDNIFKTGTIISGCDIHFHNDLQYVKIRDVESDSTPVVVGNYEGYRLRNQNDTIPLQASIIKTESGFESRAPDLNTLYVRYLNSGFSSSGDANGYSAFLPGETITVFNPLNVIEKINLQNGSSGFSADDVVVMLSAIAVQNTVGGKTFANNFFKDDLISDGTATVQIVDVPDTTTLDDAVILKIKPRVDDLRGGDSSKWTFSVGGSVQSSNTTQSDIARISSIIGSGASASIETSALGEILSVDIISKGSQYTIPPTVSIASRTASAAQISLFNATAQNYLTNIIVAGQALSPVGNTYAVTVGEGIIYQKGYFSRVSEDIVIVEKYNNSPFTPDNKVIGFETLEEIINSNQDTSLLDNATGAPNYVAPGANRLKLTPKLVTLDKAVADSRQDFLYIAEFSNGNPYKQNRQTVYNVIGNEMARKSHETYGNYSLDPFILNTKSANEFVKESTEFNIVVDPGTAYINGKRVETTFNYENGVNKGTNTVTGDATISLNYGNYVLVEELGGVFNFAEGDIVTLHANESNYITNGAGVPSDITLGDALGTARVRSLMFDSGVAGTASARYRMYLFDIKMNSGKNFKNVRSIYYYNPSFRGVCDTVLENDRAVIKDNNLSSLIFYAGQPAVKQVSSTSYVYRTVDTSLTLSDTGQVTVSAGTGEKFPYSGTLTTTQEKSIIVVPQATAEALNNLSGNITTTSASKMITGDGSAKFAEELLSGDYIKFGSVIKQIDYVANNTVAYLTSAAGVDTTSSYKLCFPANVPISFERSTRTVSTAAPDYNQLVVDIGTGLTGAVGLTLAYNVRSNPNAAVVTKTVNRNKYVRLQLSNNAATSVGPWALGVSDVFRLNKVYKGSNSNFTESTAGISDITKYFYIDHNQLEDYYGISYLYLKPNVSANLSSSDYLLVSFDHFTTTAEGIKAPGSGTYPIRDDLPLDQLTTNINTLEIPEVYGTKESLYDLRDHFDFRPQTNNSVVPTSNSMLAPLNPTEPVAMFKSGNKYFPAPDSELETTIEYYLGRTDRVVVDENKGFRVISGTAGSYTPPSQPDNSITINLVKIPPYPSIPFQLSSQLVSIIDTGVANEKFTTERLNTYRVSTLLDANDRKILQPRNYTMEEISKLERRISDLEYYTSLTLVESLTQKRNIPSSYDSNVDRFKFGFYVDGFENYQFSDISNPGYRASIVDGYLAPAVDEININLESADSDSSLPWIETKFISQLRATDGPIDQVTTSTTTTSTGTADVTTTRQLVSGVITQSIASVLQSNRNTSSSDIYPYVYEDFYYQFSAISGPVEFFINSPNNYVAVEVYQSIMDNTTYSIPILTSFFAQDISANDYFRLGDLGFENAFAPAIQRVGYGPAGGFIKDRFKLQWLHDPNQGIYYKIRVYKGKQYNPSLFRKYGAGAFIYKLFYPTDSLVNYTDLTNKTIGTGFSMSYKGLATERLTYK